MKSSYKFFLFNYLGDILNESGKQLIRHALHTQVGEFLLTRKSYATVRVSIRLREGAT